MSEKTRVILLNTPHNPTGKVFTTEELLEISDILSDYPNCYVIADEVYDFMTFDGREHVLFANIGDNWNRTITIYSGGKLLCCTGWKVGWAIAPAEILRQAVIINDCCTYCHNVPGQVAVTRSLKQAATEPFEGFDNYYAY